MTQSQDDEERRKSSLQRRRAEILCGWGLASGNCVGSLRLHRRWLAKLAPVLWILPPAGVPWAEGRVDMPRRLNRLQCRWRRFGRDGTGRDALGRSQTGPKQRWRVRWGPGFSRWAPGLARPVRGRRDVTAMAVWYTITYPWLWI